MSAKKSEVRQIAERLKAGFVAAGAEAVETDILLPAETLLDLYGEDIRGRAFVTHDPIMGEAFLRPDFTLPVALLHLESGADEARYTYAGEVFRQQEAGSRRPPEFLQAGVEVFGGDTARADAEVFALISAAVTGRGLRAVIGDIGLLRAAVAGLDTTEARRRALLRHLWRPRRFRALLKRYASAERPPRPDPDGDPFAGRGPEIGRRTREEVRARLRRLAEDAAEPPLPAGLVELLDDLMGVRETAPNALANLRTLAVDLPAIGPAIDRLDRRLDALSDRGIDTATLDLEVTYGRTSLEYYDGFVFGFVDPDRPGQPAVASGGRYDALLRALGGDHAPGAVGGVVRPALLPVRTSP